MTRGRAGSRRTRTSSSRPRLILGGIALAGVLLIAATVLSILMQPPPTDDPAPVSVRAQPLFPDLSVQPIGEINAGVDTATGRRVLNFGVMLTNLGAGEFRLRAQRSHLLSDDWRVIQLVSEEGGGYTETRTSATLVLGGDGHDHWHIRDVESHQVETPDGQVVGRVQKAGFCFFDTTHVAPELPDSPPQKVHRAAECGGRFDTRTGMGLSVGWGDDYPWHLIGQAVDITDLPDGTYRVRAVVDAYGWFDELDETNNEVWSDIQLSTGPDGLPVVRVLGTSPGT